MKISKAHFNNIFKYLTVIFFCFFLIILFFVLYRSEIFYNGSKRDYYFGYIIFLLIGTLFWGFVLFLKDQMRTNIVLISLSLFFGLYISEIILFILTPKPWQYPSRLTIAKGLGINYDERSKLQVVYDLLKSGVNAVPDIPPCLFLKTNGIPGFQPNSLFPLAGISRITTVLGNESGQHSIYMSDRHGFNNPDHVWDRNKFSIVLVGDSFAHGARVEPGEDIGGQLRKLTEYNVINLGYCGNGPFAELGSISEYAQFLKPDFVIWLYFEGNDSSIDLFNEKFSLLANYLQDDFSQRLINRQLEIDQSLTYFFEKELSLKETISKKNSSQNSSRNRFLSIASLYHLRYRFFYNRDYKDELGHLDLFRKVLKKARDRVIAWGGAALFCIFATE